VGGVGGTVAAEFAEGGEDLFGDDFEHLAGILVFEAGPAAVSWPLGKEGMGDGLFKAGGFGFGEELEIVEVAEEEEVGDLFDDLGGVGDAAGPEGVPDAVDLVADFAGEHGGLG